MDNNDMCLIPMQQIIFCNTRSNYFTRSDTEIIEDREIEGVNSQMEFALSQNEHDSMSGLMSLCNIIEEKKGPVVKLLYQKSFFESIICLINSPSPRVTQNAIECVFFSFYYGTGDILPLIHSEELFMAIIDHLQFSSPGSTIFMICKCIHMILSKCFSEMTINEINNLLSRLAIVTNEAFHSVPRRSPLLMISCIDDSDNDSGEMESTGDIETILYSVLSLFGSMIKPFSSFLTEKMLEDISLYFCNALSLTGMKTLQKTALNCLGILSETFINICISALIQENAIETVIVLTREPDQNKAEVSLRILHNIMKFEPGLFDFKSVFPSIEKIIISNEFGSNSVTYTVAMDILRSISDKDEYSELILNSQLFNNINGRVSQSDFGYKLKSLEFIAAFGSHYWNNILLEYPNILLEAINVLNLLEPSANEVFLMQLINIVYRAIELSNNETRNMIINNIDENHLIEYFGFCSSIEALLYQIGENRVSNHKT